MKRTARTEQAARARQPDTRGGSDSAKGTPQEAADSFCRVLDALDEVFFSLDVRSRKVLEIGASCRRVLGRPCDDFVTDAALLDRMVHPDDRALVHAARAAAASQPIDVQYRVLHSTGAVRWIRERGLLLSDDQRRPLRFDGVLTDVTERRRIEEALRESQRAMHTLLSNLPGIAYRCRNDQHWTLEFISEGALELTGYPAADLVGNRRVAYADLIHEEDRQPVWDMVQEAVAAKRPFQLVYRLRMPGQNPKWVWEQGRAVYDAEGNVAALEGFITDITDRTLSQQALRDNKARLRQIIDLVPHFIFAKDRDGRFFLVNQAVADVYGSTVEGLIGKTDADFARSIEEAQRFRRDDLEVIDGGRPKLIPEERITDTQGRVRILQTTKIPFRVAGSGAPAVLGVAVDLTERRQAEEALRESEERWRRLSEAAFEGIIVFDQGRIIEANQELAAMLGYEPAALVGVDLLNVIAPDSRDLVGHHLGTGYEKPYELSALRADGTWIRVEACSRTSPYRGRTATVMVVRDITARVAADAALSRADRLAALGTMVAGVAHELNNPLTTICGLAGLLAKDRSLPPQARQHARDIAEQGLRCTTIVENLLGLARSKKMPDEPVDINRLLASCVKIVRGDPTFASIKIEETYAEALAPVVAGIYRLEQVFFNILRNARDALREVKHQKRLQIRTAAAGPWVRITFTDNGGGIREVHRVFDPFYTTKSAGEGTGLGLSISYGIIQDHGGRILAENVPHGARFTIDLPMEPATLQPEPPAATPRDGT